MKILSLMVIFPIICVSCTRGREVSKEDFKAKAQAVETHFFKETSVTVNYSAKGMVYSDGKIGFVDTNKTIKAEFKWYDDQPELVRKDAGSLDVALLKSLLKVNIKTIAEKLDGFQTGFTFHIDPLGIGYKDETSETFKSYDDYGYIKRYETYSKTTLKEIQGSGQLDNTFEYKSNMTFTHKD